MTASPTPDGATAVTIYVDPICPFAWLTSRWLLEVEAVRSIAVTVDLASLSALNEDRAGLPPFYVDLLAVGWTTARVATAVRAHGGPAALRRFYDEFGVRHHVARREIDGELIVAALGAAGLPVELAAAADDNGLDDDIRQIRRHLGELVGDEVGTPVLAVTPASGPGFAIFGPVLTATPRGEIAGRLWDAATTLAAHDDFFELKRSRTRPLDLAGTAI